MERRQFTREFKLEAVRLIKERGVSYTQATEDLGVHPMQLRNLVKQLADDPQHAFPGQGQLRAIRRPVSSMIGAVNACRTTRISTRWPRSLSFRILSKVSSKAPLACTT